MRSGGRRSGDEEAQAAALTDLNQAIVESGWLLPLFEQLAPVGLQRGEGRRAHLPGPDSFPLLASLQPAS